MQLTNRQGRAAAKRMRAISKSLMAEQPFFGSLCLKLKMEEDPRMETIGADGEFLRYSPEWVNETQAHKIKQAIARVVIGCALKHHTRRNGRANVDWQKASLMACQPILCDAGYMDNPGPHPELPAEKIYDLIHAEEEEADPGGDEKGKDGAGDQTQDPTGGMGSVMDAPEKANPAEEEMQWDEHIAQSQAMADRAKKPGCSKGTWKEQISGGRAQVDWRTVLNRYLTKATREDYSWTRPNRRYMASGLYLPDLYSESSGDLIFAIDTSGSMKREILYSVWSEVKAAAIQIKPASVTVIQCDVEIRAEAQYDWSNLPEEIYARGRGGTRFAPVFRRVLESGLNASALVYLTDNYVDLRHYGDDPGLPVIWACYGEPERIALPPFGELLHVAAD